MATSGDPRKALEAIVGSLQNTFKKFERTARKKAWKSLQSGKGKTEIDGLLNNPSQQVTGLARLLSFKEWLSQTDHD
jgi:hypothetical protein